MKIYLAIIQGREGNGFAAVDVFASEQSAIEFVKKYILNYYTEDQIKYCLKNFGGDLDKGQFNSEDEMIWVEEREIIE